MEAWWSGLEGFSKVLWVVAVFSTVIFLLQLVLTFVGAEAHSDGGNGFGGDGGFDGQGDFGGGDADAGAGGHIGGETAEAQDGGTTGYFTLRNMIAFFLGFSWFGLAARDFGASQPLSALAGVAAGCVFVAAVMGLLKALSALKDSGTISIKEAVGQAGSVAIAIPGAMEGRGKVSLVLRGQLIELEAATRGAKLSKGQQIVVTGLIGGDAVIVETA